MAERVNHSKYPSVPVVSAFHVTIVVTIEDGKNLNNISQEHLGRT